MTDATTSRQQRFVEVMSGRARGAAPALMRSAASLASAIYGVAVRRRNHGYDAGRRAVFRLDRPVVSVGNISAGGTGKTVLVEQIARWVLESTRGPAMKNALAGGSRLNEHVGLACGSGPRAAILMRGYKGDRSPVGSDEAALLRQLLPGVTVEADPDRVSAGRRLLAGENPPDIFILDDGFQHRRLHRDLDVVAVDATMDLDGPLARLLPRGLLREPAGSLARADFVVITRADQAPAGNVDRLARRIRSVDPGLAILRCRHAPTRLVGRGESRALADLAGRRFLAFCGIGNPEGFRATCGGLGGECIDFVAFDDHHVYSEDDLGELASRARLAGAELMLTTQKDYVKLAGRADSLRPEILALGVEIEWLGDGGEPLRNAVLGLLTRVIRKEDRT